MRKYLIIMSVCLVTSISLHVNLKSNHDGLTITLDNVEALANTGSSTVKCFDDGSIDCPALPKKVRYIVDEL